MLKDLNYKLKYLVDKYIPDVPKYTINAPRQDGLYTLTIESGECIPLLYWRFERRFTELRNTVIDGTLNDIRSIRATHAAHTSVPLDFLMYKELDICMFLADSDVESIFNSANGNCAANLIVRLQNGVLCIIELSVSLPENAQEIDKHIIISRSGLASDMVVDTQIRQNSIYLYKNNEKHKEYTDVDFELYGLTPTEVAVVRCAFGILSKYKDASKFKLIDNKLKNLVDIANRSNLTVKRMAVGGRK